MIPAVALIHPGDPESVRVIVVEVPGKTAEEIFTVIHEWIIARATGPRNAIQIADRETMVLMAKLYTEDAVRIFLSAYPISFTWKFEVKDGKFRLTMADIRLTKSISQGMSQEHYNKIWAWEDAQIADLLARMDKTQDSDW